ncbi:hypothetical protein [Alteromonas ponticola]|uniref:DUF202 domain-containing protein n=1 Tax=Alteromonas ponticola TaxID=2720613 RepID=A0ABX1R3V2_9ALTE|nr:hypothetical protein [Alteromonas ponticola]NMH60744.1 hypothetical protein [Alteromonas ponticola]
MSTLITDMNSETRFFGLSKSWHRFKWGLLVFALGASGMLFADAQSIVTLWVSVTIMLIGFALAMSGYVGIFLNRFNRLRETRSRPNPFD